MSNVEAEQAAQTDDESWKDFVDTICEFLRITMLAIQPDRRLSYLKILTSVAADVEARIRLATRLEEHFRNGHNRRD